MVSSRATTAALAVVAAATGLAVAGCGGGGPKLYSLEKTKSCLEDRGVVLGRSLDFVASTAPGGAVRAVFGRNVVTIAFGTTEEEAAALDQGYRRVAGSEVPIDQLLDQRKNAVILWAQAPTATQAGLIDSCLR